jgi:hypothetical protein
VKTSNLKQYVDMQYGEETMEPPRIMEEDENAIKETEE